jgi:uncharacterized protein (UPF0276 family)
LGLRIDPYEAVLREQPRVDWFEVISENYLAANRSTTWIACANATQS